MEIISLKSSAGADSCDGPKRGGRGVSEGSGAKHSVSELKAAVHGQNRVNVFVDGEYALSLDIAQVVELGVKVGRELSDAELAELKKASEFGKLYQRTLEWVLTRPHSLKETRDYLKRTIAKRRMENLKRSRQEKMKLLPEISSEQTDLVLKTLVERGYLDDAKFATFYVENRLTKKGVSRRRLEMELAKKGISSELASNVIRESARNDEAEICKIIAKKANKYSPEKMVQYLIRQGFDYQLAQSLVAREMGSQSWE